MLLGLGQKSERGGFWKYRNPLKEHIGGGLESFSRFHLVQKIFSADCEDSLIGENQEPQCVHTDSKENCPGAGNGPNEQVCRERIE